VFIFSCGLDAFPGAIRYRHRENGWEIALHPIGDAQFDFNEGSDEEINRRIRAADYFTPAQLEQVSGIARHIRANYETLRGTPEVQRAERLRSLIKRIPPGSKLVLLLDHDRIRNADDAVQPIPFIRRYNDMVRSVQCEYSYVAAVSFSDVIAEDSEIQTGGNHYHRVVYQRMAESLAEVIRQLAPKPGPIEDMSAMQRGPTPVALSVSTLIENEWVG